MTAGNNDHGRLGLGDRADRGNNANEMGDFLPAVSLGTGVYIPPGDPMNDDVPGIGTPPVEIPVGTGGGSLPVDLSDIFPGLADVNMVTLNPTPYTPHPTPYTLHPTP
jgi:hypothetical protein